MELHSFKLRNSFIFYVICTLCLCYIVSSEGKNARLHTRRTGIHKIIKPDIIQRKHLKLVRPPTLSQFSTSGLSLRDPYNNIKRQEETLEQNTNEMNEDSQIETVFNSGVKRLFKFLRGFAKPSEDEGSNEGEETSIKLPASTFIPPSLFRNYDLSSLIKLIENMDDSQIEQLAESAFVDTISQLIGIVGINDLREWLGLIVGYFLLGPVFVPLFWLPVSVYIMIGLLAPLFYFNPPSKLNTNQMGHDPIKPEGEEGEGRMARLILETVENFRSDDTNSSAPNLIQNQTKLEDTTPSIVETCLERLSCQITRFSRDNPVSNWLTGKLNATKVEWARTLNGDPSQAERLQLREDCAKYKCSIFPSQVQRFISFWTD